MVKFMEQIAIISDIHGNLEALKSVLEDIRERKISNIMCIGDIIYFYQVKILFQKK